MFIIIIIIQFMTAEQLSSFYRLKIFSAAWENYTLEFDCPLQWSVNQIKSYITHVHPRIQFHLFELALGGRIINSKERLKHILQIRKDKDNLILFIVQRQSTRFQDYYCQRMKKFEQQLQQQFDSLIGKENKDNEINYLPILNHKFQDFLKVKNGINVQNVPNLPLNNNNNNIVVPQQENNNGFGLFSILRIILIYTVVISLYSYGTWQQFGIVLFILLLHYLVDAEGRRRRENNNNVNGNNGNVVVRNVQNNEVNNQNNENINNGGNVNENRNENENKEVRKRIFVKKGFSMKRIIYKYGQGLYCYFFSLFPNWNVEDYLERNKEIIEARKRQIQQQNFVEQKIQ